MRKLNVEKYGEYDPDLKIKVNPIEYPERAVLPRLDHLLEMITQLNPEILSQFITNLINKAQSLNDVNYLEKLDIDVSSSLENLEKLKNHIELAEEIYNLAIMFQDLPTSDLSSEEEIEILHKNVLRGFLFPIYYQILVLIETLGKKKAVDLYEKHVETYILNHPRIPKIKDLDTLRENTINGALEWGEVRVVSEIENGKYIVRKDSCRWYDVLKELDDPEISHLAACIGDFASCTARNKNFVLTRSYTIVQGHPYCDEVFHDKSINEEIIHPSKEFFDNL